MHSELKKKTQESIEAIHALFEDCDLAMLVDQETGLVLSKSAAAPISQSVLETLAGEAQSQLSGKLAQGIANSVKAPEILSVSQYSKAGVLVILQDLRNSEDALVCRFKTSPKRSDLVAMANDIFKLSSSAEVA